MRHSVAAPHTSAGGTGALAAVQTWTRGKEQEKKIWSTAAVGEGPLTHREPARQRGCLSVEQAAGALGRLRRVRQ